MKCVSYVCANVAHVLRILTYNDINEKIEN